MKLIAPSTDPVEKIHDLVEYSKILQENGADYLHCDVMDGVFVKRKTIDDEAIKLINANTVIPLDVHLMVENPSDKIDNYISSGANIITIHYECFKNEEKLIEIINKIKANKCLAGVSVKPDTKIEKIYNILQYIDLILIMSVEPGKSGQTFINETYEKVEKIDEYRKNNNLKFIIEIDGGINPEISQKLFRMNTDMIVSGNFIFKAENKKEAIEILRI